MRSAIGVYSRERRSPTVKSASIHSKEKTLLLEIRMSSSRRAVAAIAPKEEVYARRRCDS